MTDLQARNNLALLQIEPLFYRNFGVWWWWVKSELRRRGLTKDQFYGLGEFAEPTAWDAYEGLSPAARTQAALDHQADHTFVKRNSDTSMLPPDAGGGPYVLYDPDIEVH